MLLQEVQAPNTMSKTVIKKYLLEKLFHANYYMVLAQNFNNKAYDEKINEYHNKFLTVIEIAKDLGINVDEEFSKYEKKRVKQLEKDGVKIDFYKKMLEEL